MQTNSKIMFSVNTEREQRFTVSPKVIEKAFEIGAIRVTQTENIEQIWFAKEEHYSGRIRHTLAPLGKGGECFEHTVKHHVSDGVDYEMTTCIAARDYELLGKIYRDCEKEAKIRLYVVDEKHEYDEYYVTIDYPSDKKDECWVEFESKSGKKLPFKKPEWLD